MVSDRLVVNGIPVDEHVSDAYGGIGCHRRIIRNWQNYRTPTGLLMPSVLGVSRADDPVSHWSGKWDMGAASLDAPLQATFIDRTSTTNRAMWGARLSDRPGHWCNLKLHEATAPGEPDIDDGRLFWRDVFDGVDLELEPGSAWIGKTLIVRSRTAPASIVLTVRPAPGHGYQVRAGVLEVFDRSGAVWLKTRPVWGADAAGDPVPVTLRDNGPVRIETGAYVGSVRVSWSIPESAVLPVRIDPTVTISGVAAIEDNHMSAGAPNNNCGGSAGLLLGRPNADVARRGLVRMSIASIPAWPITAYTMALYRYGHAGSTAAGVLSAHIVTAGNTWVEGTVANGIEAGSSCWNFAKHNTQAWAGSAGCFGAGDVDASPSPPTLAYNAYAAGPDVQMLFALDPSWARLWRSGRVNNGILIKDTVEANGSLVAARSSEAGANALSFTVDYTRAATHRKQAATRY